MDTYMLPLDENAAKEMEHDLIELGFNAEVTRRWVHSGPHAGTQQLCVLWQNGDCRENGMIWCEKDYCYIVEPLKHTGTTQAQRAIACGAMARQWNRMDILAECAPAAIRPPGEYDYEWL